MNKQLVVKLIGIVVALMISHCSINAQTYTVNSLLDSSDSSPGDGNCDDGSGNCTLRCAIEEANAVAGIQNIQFSIAGNVPVGGFLIITEGVNIDGNNSITLNNASGIGIDALLVNSNDVTVTKLIIDGNFNTGISFNGNNNSATLLTIRNTTNRGLSLNGSNNTINTCLIEDCFNGVLIVSGSLNLVSNTEIHGTTVNGISLTNSDNNTLTNNKIYNSSNRGLYFYLNTNSNTVTNNEIYNNSRGVILTNNTGYTFTNNIVYDNSTLGVFIEGSNHTIENNTCYDNSQYNLQCEFVANSSVSNNTLTGSSYSIYFRDCNTIQCTGNQINGSNRGIRVSWNCQDINISQNTIYRNGWRGIELENNSNTYSITMSENSIYCNPEAIDIGPLTQDNILEPSIISANASLVNGISDPGNIIELFTGSINTCGETGCNSPTYLQTTTSDGSGNWSFGSSFTPYDLVTVTQTNSNGSTSELSDCFMICDFLNIDAVSNQNYCQGASVDPINFSSTSSSSSLEFKWTANNTSIGIPATSGYGDIPNFIGIVGTTTFTVTAFHDNR